MELIDRYIYAVTKRLPLKQREDIEKELRSLIDDMLASRCAGREPLKEDVIAVLNELGDPAILAAKYRDDKCYLIGPEYFYTYLTVMKTVVITLAAGTAIGHAIGIALEPPEHVFAGIVELIAAVVSGAFQGFAWVTIVFAVMERVNNKDIQNVAKRKWSVSELPKIPKKEELIKPSDPITGIVFSVVFLVVFCLAYRYIGAYFSDGGGIKVIPVFSEQFQNFIPLIIALFCFSVLKESLKLIAGRWTINLGIAVTAINIVLFVISIAVFTNPNVWNGNFVSELDAAGMVPADLDISLDTVFAGLRKGFVALLAFTYGIDAIFALVKGVKYSK